ncbi:rod shape-determining protein MreD [Staphylococcus hyicus]|uniref:rod shape-determining protein MreD n=1 Tax=Staphylococcus hyicus TaxID=1284 RepID=UPI00211BA5F4|nr:rod shape-determining protein MreD [Staphylococcus hyicus]MCQ9290982.1 rod shape-determining protein MreD [Staphylococcus hyicus]MCQ9306223.1 rod shape-determining protein MreD [Staphylococcus hyicus]MCQ9308636.1 rod shape-determining protein MreD [Staphylococcus hyicus]MCQ9311057.1 rod shape-determining protein MreD [Staphylococcus hyicus]MDP4460035.1 rod shape-determining protein MreD [Staphylococcus hyicus]
MKRASIYLILAFVSFYLDTILTMLSPIKLFGIQFIMVPRLTLIFLLLITFYRNVYVALILGLFLGLMTDLYFGEIYGVYLISYLICILFVEKFFSLFYRDHTIVFIVILASVVVLDIFVALIYHLVGLIDFNILNYSIYRAPFTLLLNALLLIFIYSVLDYRQKRKRSIDIKIK